MNIVQANLARIISEKGFVKAGVAKRAGLTGQQLSDMLAGRKVIRAEKLPDLCRSLDVPMSELFREDEQQREI